RSPRVNGIALPHGVLDPVRSPANPTFCLCAASQSSPTAAHQAQSNNHRQLALCLAPPIHQTKPIAHAPCSGLVQSIFSSPARLRSPSLPAYTCCRRAAKLKMLCNMCCSTYALCDRHPARCLPAVCARGGAAHSPPPSDHLMNRVRRPPLQHPLALLFDRAVDSLCVALSDETIRHYRGTVRNFLSYLGADHPGVQRLDQLRREPHILGWMSRLHSQVPPLGTTSYIIRLITLRPILNELAWTEQLPELAHLLRREDIPRAPQRLPRPLTAEQDQLLQQEFLRRNDLGGNVFLLMRHTGMRIGECADLSVDCLRSTGPNQWAIHVPLGKLKTERMVPVDSFVRELVQRLRFFRSLDPLPADGRLLARPGAKDTLLRNSR